MATKKKARFLSFKENYGKFLVAIKLEGGGGTKKKTDFFCGSPNQILLMSIFLFIRRNCIKDLYFTGDTYTRDSSDIKGKSEF